MPRWILSIHRGISQLDRESCYTKAAGIALHRTLEWVEGIGDQWKYPEFFRPRELGRARRQPSFMGMSRIAECSLSSLRVLRCDGTVAAKVMPSIEEPRTFACLGHGIEFQRYKKARAAMRRSASRTLRVLAAAATALRKSCETAYTDFASFTVGLITY